MNPQEEMSLIEHLTELRYRLVRSIQGIFLGSALGIYYADYIMAIIRKPILPFLGDGGGLVFTGVMDKFMAHLKVGALSGVILTCPYWLYHLWQFISPGLYKNERRYAGGFIFSGSVLFLLGVGFVYFFVYPTAFEYLLAFGGDVDKPMITIGEYLGFFVMTTLLFGLSFELPLVMVVLAIMGVIDVDFLRKNRRYAIVVLAVLSAVLTPPDIVSMCMMLVPLYALYEIAIWVIYFMIPKINKPVV